VSPVIMKTVKTTHFLSPEGC